MEKRKSSKHLGDYVETTNQQSGLTANQLKMIAIVAMTIDHIGWAFVETTTPLGIGMHLIGRFTMPIMCFFIAEGYHYTRNIKKYAMRLLFFALLPYLPFIFYRTGALPNAESFLMLNVIFVLLLGLIALHLHNTIKQPALRWLLTIPILYLASFCDWQYFGVLFILAFGLNRRNFRKQAFWFSAVVLLYYIELYWPYGMLLYRTINGRYTISQAKELLSTFPHLYYLSHAVMRMGLLLSLILLSKYNGKKGRDLPGGKWFFYIYYPLHLLIIGFFLFFVFE
jgi:hypothetical protein